MQLVHDLYCYIVHTVCTTYWFCTYGIYPYWFFSPTWLRPFSLICYLCIICSQISVKNNAHKWKLYEPAVSQNWITEKWNNANFKTVYETFYSAVYSEMLLPLLLHIVCNKMYGLKQNFKNPCTKWLSWLLICGRKMCRVGGIHFSTYKTLSCFYYNEAVFFDHVLSQ